MIKSEDLSPTHRFDSASSRYACTTGVAREVAAKPGRGGWSRKWGCEVDVSSVLCVCSPREDQRRGLSNTL